MMTDYVKPVGTTITAPYLWLIVMLIAMTAAAVVFFVLSAHNNRDRKKYDEKVKQYFSMIRLMSSEYSSIYYVDLMDDVVIPFTMSDRIEGMFGDAFKKLSYSESVKAYVASAVSDAQKAEMLEVLSAPFLMNMMKDKNIYSRLYLNNENRFTEMKCVCGDDFEITRTVVLGFSVKDDEIRADIDAKQRIERNMEIIRILASEYSSVYYIDLETEAVTPYTMNEDTENEFGSIFRGNISYTEAFSMYVDRMVYDLDRSAMLQAGALKNIIEKLRYTKTFVTTYRSGSGGEPHFCEMKFVKVDDDDEQPTAVALAFADRDSEIMGRFIDKRLREEYDAIYLVDLPINRQRMYAYTEIYKRFSGTMYSENLRAFAKTLKPEYREVWMELEFPSNVQKFLEKEDRRELIFELEEGTTTWNRSVWQVVERKNGQPVKVLISFMEIDNVRAEKLRLDAKINEQKKELEAQQVQLEEALSRAEAANRSKSAFLSNMSHDIRTPMNAIIGFTTLAEDNIENTARVKDYLNKINVSGKHLLSLINDVLDMSRIESGKIKLEEVNCNLAEIMHELKTITVGQAQAKEQELKIECIDIIDDEIVCDKLRLQQVLINLISNAIKFTPVGGTIQVYVRQTAGEIGFGTYEFRVVDNGIGMTPEFKDKIFQPFERANTSTISKTQGTGLGMSITKNLIDLMGGTIEVNSEQGKGSEFIVNLVIKLQDNESGCSLIDEYEGKRALIICEDYSTGDSVSKLLSKQGIDADWTIHGPEAGKLIDDRMHNGEPYDIFFIDWMSDDNCAKNTALLRSKIGPKVPIIIMYFGDRNVLESGAREAGADALLERPVFMSELHKVLLQIAGLDASEEIPEFDVNALTGKHILIVEDNELNLEIAKTILEEHGLVTDTATDGSIAVDKVKVSRSGTYDLILMDIQMPVVDGFAATRAIRELEEEDKANIPIVAMTANAFAEDSVAAFAAGMNEHIAKPIDVQRLLGVIARFVK